ncbi:hypothetical protein HY032_03030 [Candidatus Gottesmanbacteria bacterium]|nr:hypothetical protein [Candidatus Gottesmanbacteria bacterium]
MEDKLRAIVEKIEQSKLSDQDKQKLYVTITEELYTTAFPVLVKHMDRGTLEDLGNNPSKVTVESYAKLLGDAVKDGRAIEEVANVVD